MASSSDFTAPITVSNDTLTVQEQHADDRTSSESPLDQVHGAAPTTVPEEALAIEEQRGDRGPSESALAQTNVLPWADTPSWSFEAVLAPRHGDEPLVDNDLVTTDAPRLANPLFPPEAEGDRRLRRVARSGSLRSLALRQEAPAAPPNEGDEGGVGGAPAQEQEEEEDDEEVEVVGVVGVVEEEEWEEEVEGEEEEDEDEEDAGRVNLDEVDAPVADHVRAGLAWLGGVRQEVDVLDVAIPMVDFRGHPAAMRARADLLMASEEIQAALGMLWRSLVEARRTAGDALAGNRRFQDEALRLTTEFVAFQLQAVGWREDAVANEALLREAELEIAALRARLGDEGGN